jgi:ankyrin repeat protein
MSESISKAQQEQMRIALAQIDEIPTKAEARTRNVSIVVFKEQAIATIEKNIQAVPLNKTGVLAEKIGRMAELRKSVEETKAHSYLGWIQLMLDRCINFLTRHGAVTKSEWAQHVSDELKTQHEKIVPIQRHFQTITKEKNLLAPDVLKALVSLSPEELKKAVQEDIFNIDRLKDLDLYDRFRTTMPYVLTQDLKDAFKEGLEWREAHYADNESSRKIRLVQAIRSGDLEYAKSLINSSPSIEINIVEEAVNVEKADALKLILDQKKCKDINTSSTLNNTPLEVVVQKRDIEKVRLLLEAGADPIITRGAFSGSSALHSAAKGSGNEDIFKVILSKVDKKDIDLQDEIGRTALSLAILDENPAKVTQLLKQGANPSLKPAFGFTPLQLAINSGNVTIISLLKEAGAEITEEAKQAISPERADIKELLLSPQEKLEYAIKTGDITQVTRLINELEEISCHTLCLALLSLTRNATLIEQAFLSPETLKKVQDLNTPQIIEGRPRTALQIAVAHGNIKTIHALLKQGVDPTLPLAVYGGDSLLQHIAQFGTMWSALQALCTDLDADKLNLKDSSGHTILYYAAANGNARNVKFLLERGADPNIDAEPDAPLSALLKSAISDVDADKDLQVVTSLIEYGARISQQHIDKALARPLSALNDKIVEGWKQQESRLAAKPTSLPPEKLMENAIENEDVQEVRRLISEAKAIESRDLFTALKVKNQAIVNLFINSKKAIRNIDSIHDETTALGLAVLSRSEAVSFLVEQGANLAIKDTSGRTALHYAVITYKSWEDKELIELLLSKLSPEQINEKDYAGHTALYDAVDADNLEIVQLLLKSHANPNRSAPRSLLQKAIGNLNPQMVETLIQHGATVTNADKKYVEQINRPESNKIIEDAWKRQQQLNEERTSL